MTQTFSEFLPVPSLGPLASKAASDADDQVCKVSTLEAFLCKVTTEATFEKWRLSLFLQCHIWRRALPDHAHTSVSQGPLVHAHTSVSPLVHAHTSVSPLVHVHARTSVSPLVDAHTSVSLRSASKTARGPTQEALRRFCPALEGGEPPGEGHNSGLAERVAAREVPSTNGSEFDLN